MLKRELWGIALLPAFFPLYLVRFQAWGVPVSLVEVLIYISFLVFVGRRFKLWKNFRLYNFFIQLWVPITLIVVGTLAGIFVQENPELFRHGLGIFKEWIFAPLLYLVMVVKVEKDREHLELAIYSYILSASVLAAWGLWQVATGNFVTVDGRASAVFQSANYLALYIGPAVLAAGILLFERVFASEWLYRGVYAAVFVILALALVFSASYAGILAVAFGFFVYFVWKIRGLSWRHVGPLLAAVILFFGAFAMSQWNSYKFQDFLDFDAQSSSSARLQIWTVALHAIAEHPLAGLGPGAFQNYYDVRAEEVLGVEPFDKTALHPHNVFLTFWLYAGILGLTGFVWMCVILIVKFVNAIRHAQGSHRTLLMMLFSMFLVMLFHGLFDVPFWKNDLALVWWFTLGSGLSLMKT